MGRATDKILNDIVKTIVKAAHPEKIIVLGSRAAGSATSDSDIDLLIVDPKGFSHERSRRAEVARISRLLAGFTVPLDILIYSADEVKSWQNSPNHIISRALESGKTIYERH
jgi:predicted nucleotidyltransferase